MALKQSMLKRSVWHINAYTVVRGMCQVNGGGLF